MAQDSSSSNAGKQSTQESSHESQSASTADAIQGPDHERHDEGEVELDAYEEEEDEEELSEEFLDSMEKNFKDDLAAALNDLSGCSGSFFSYRACADAPNPMIAINDFGPLGLPLSEHEAKRLAASSVQAPFGMGEKTLVDKSVRDTWEIDSAKITFGNPAWKNWVDKVVVPQVCETLGVSLASSTPRAELYKLLLYETGSHFLPHQDTEKAPGMFATIVIVLPSQFSGGEVHLSHAGQTQVIDVASNSSCMTHAMAWYTDIMHSVKPVQSGYRLALSYNLLHRANSLKPKANVSAENIEKVRNLLVDWKKVQDFGYDDVVPQKLCFSMDHQYSQKNLQSARFKGGDARWVEALAPMAADLKFGLFVANIKLCKTGSCEDNSGEGVFWRGPTTNTAGLEMTEVYNEELSITSVFDVDGTPLTVGQVSIEADDDELIPGGLGDGDPDKEKYTGYTGNEGGDLEYWYHDTVLILCPDVNLFSIDRSEIDGYVRGLLNSLRLDAPAPIDEDTALMNRVLRLMSRNLPQSTLKHILAVFLNAAIKWKRPDVWQVAVNACPPQNRIEAVGYDGFLSAHLSFGLLAIEKSLVAALESERTNTRRITLIERFLEQATDQGDGPLIAWFQTFKLYVQSTLRAPEQSDVDFLAAATRQNGAKYLNDVIMPQLEKFKPNLSFWNALLSQLSHNQAEIPDTQVLEEIISKLVARIHADTPAFPKIAKERRSYYDDKAEPDIKTWLGIFELCLLAPSVYSKNCAEYIDRMKSSYAGESTVEKSWIADEFMDAAVKRLDELVSSKPKTEQAGTTLTDFFSFALEVLAEHRILSPKWNTNIDGLLKALKRSHVHALRVKLTKGVIDSLVKKHTALARTLLNGVFEAKTSRPRDASDARECEEIITDILKSIIGETEFDSDMSDIKHWRLPTHEIVSPSLTVAMDLIQLCYACECRSLVPSILDELVWESSYSESKRSRNNWAIQVLVPMIPRLRSFLSKHGQNLTDEPYRRFVAAALKEYVGHVLGTKPQETVSIAKISAFGCGCKNCESLKNFFIGNELVFKFQERTDVKKHVEQELRKTSRWGVTWKTITWTSPHTLQISKGDAMTSLLHWQETQKRGLKFMQSVGNFEALSSILGQGFSDIADALGYRSPLAEKPLDGNKGAQQGSSKAGAKATVQKGTGSEGCGSKRSSVGSDASLKRMKLQDMDVIDIAD